MTPENYNNRFASILQYMMGLTNRKRQDYAGSEDVFKNFQLIEVVTSGRISTAGGILVRLTDKLQRVANLLARPNAVADEKIEDTLLDNAIYSIILYIWLTRDKAELVFPGQEVTEPTEATLPEGYSPLPPEVNQNTLEETYDTLSAKVLAGRISELSPTERSYLELVTKMKMGIGAYDGPIAGARV